MKKLLVVLSAMMLMIFASSGISLAKDTDPGENPNLNTRTGDIKDTLTPDQQKDQKAKMEKFNKYLKEFPAKQNSQSSNINATSYYEWHFSIPVGEQEKSYWCGPASAKGMLGVKGFNPTQTYLANLMGTTTDGTFDYKVKDGLNSYLNSKGVIQWYMLDTLSTFGGYISMISFDAESNWAWDHLLHTEIGYLPNYQRHHSHYIAGNGYKGDKASANWEWYTDTYQEYDTGGSGGTHSGASHNTLGEHYTGAYNVYYCNISHPNKSLIW